MKSTPTSLRNGRWWRRSAGLLLLLASTWNAASQGANGPVRPDFSSFRLITERNIFNAGRSRGSSRSTGERPRPRVADAFTFVGTLQSEKGLLAFFDGTSSDYRKVLKTEGTIAGHKVSAITANTVKLQAGTNRFELRLGMQMRREEEGPWEPSTRSESFASSRGSAGSDGVRPASSPSFGGLPPRSPGTTVSAAAPTSAGDSAGEDSEVLKRLMQKREQ